MGTFSTQARKPDQELITSRQCLLQRGTIIARVRFLFAVLEPDWLSHSHRRQWRLRY
jgi:hypothetical protein